MGSGPICFDTLRVFIEIGKTAIEQKVLIPDALRTTQSTMASSVQMEQEKFDMEVH